MKKRSKKWKLEIISTSKSDAGGFKETIFSVSEAIYTPTLSMSQGSSSSKNSKQKLKVELYFSSNYSCIA